MANFGTLFYTEVGIYIAEKASFAHMAVSVIDTKTKTSTRFDPISLLTIQSGEGDNSASLGAATAKSTSVLGMHV